MPDASAALPSRRPTDRRRGRGVGSDLVDDLQAVLVVPLLPHGGEPVLQGQVTGRGVPGSDGDPYRPHRRLVPGSPEQRLECRTRVATATLRGIDRVPDLHHAVGIRWSVEAGATGGQGLVLVPDDAGDPARAGGVPTSLLAPPRPRAAPLGSGEVLGQRYRAARLGTSKVTGGQRVEHRACQMDDADPAAAATGGDLGRALIGWHGHALHTSAGRSALSSERYGAGRQDSPVSIEDVTAPGP